MLSITLQAVRPILTADQKRNRKSFLPPRSARMRFCKSVWSVDAVSVSGLDRANTSMLGLWCRRSLFRAVSPLQCYRSDGSRALCQRQG